MELKNKVAIVTGGAVRIGRAITLALAEKGCHILLHYGRSSLPASQTKSEAERFGVQVETFSANLGEAAAAQQIINAALARFGKPHILINSAAIFPEEDTFYTTDAALFDQLIQVNLRAPFLLSQAFARAVGSEGQAKIINITDARIFRPRPDHFVYRLTKLAVHAMTEMTPQVVAPNITVNGLALGAILPPPGADAAYLQQVAQERVPVNRTGSAEIVAQNVIHLLEQDFINGAILKLDGGEFLG